MLSTASLSVLQEITVSQNKYLVTVHPDPELTTEAFFKVYNDPSFWKARKVARIKFESPEYVTFNESRNRKQWILNMKEKEELMKILNSDESGMKCWNRLIDIYNKEILKGKNKLVGFIPLSPNLRMPDYLKLKEGGN